jgi:hypothetical protein
LRDRGALAYSADSYADGKLLHFARLATALLFWRAVSDANRLFNRSGTVREAVRYINHPALTNSAILTLIISQHLAFLGASLVFFRTIANNTAIQIVLALIFSSFSFLYATVHTAGSEAGSAVLVLLIAAFSVEIARSSPLNFRRWVLLSGLLFVAVLTRYINAVLFVLPVIAATLPCLKDGRGPLEVCRSAASRHRSRSKKGIMSRASHVRSMRLLVRLIQRIPEQCYSG